ncbi:MAG: hypothetical protein PHO26_06115 [Dehalococcoidia bacterium]|nr:hypothetical protein [Dehalococcoidia bacterium]MDD5495147.1 hypothetical protein [Dehalococcoidia bacterium]
MTFNLSQRTRKLLISLAAGLMGNLLAYLSSLLTPMHPQVTFDFSHLATFGIAVAFGPVYGLITGAIGAIYPYFEFAVWGIWGPVAGLAIIFGKAMTGFVCGLLKDRMPPFLAVTLSFIPESLFTFGFLQVMTVYLPAGTVNWDMITNIIVEGWVEVIMFSFIIETVMRRKVMELAVIMLEIFIIMFLVHKEFTHTLLLLLLITFTILVLFEIINPRIKKKDTWTHHDGDEPPPTI